MTMLKQAS
jgi:hypothetical protein